jgi:hypothetical protein
VWGGPALAADESVRTVLGVSAIASLLVRRLTMVLRLLPPLLAALVPVL